MAKWKVVATRTPLILRSSVFNRQLLQCPDGKIISVAGIPFDQIPESKNQRLLGRCADGVSVAVRMNVSVGDFEWIKG